MNLLLKASEIKLDFYFLIGKEVTFASDYISIGGMLLHAKGEKAFISDVEYTEGYWSRLGFWIVPKISTFKINGVPSTCWLPTAFEEYNTNNQPQK